MSYNTSYTTLPTFTSNSIGYLVANQDYTTNTTNTNQPIFSESVNPGIYLFTCCVGFNIPATGISNISFNLTGTTGTTTSTICSYEGILSNSYTSGSSNLLCETLSHVFPINNTSTLTFTIAYPQATTIPQPQYQTIDALSYSLVKIA